MCKMQIFTNANYDFIRWRWHAIALSLVVIGAGAALMITRGLPLGIDFSGGTSLVVRFSQDVTLDQVRNAVASLPGEEVVQQFGEPSERRVLIRLPQEEGVEEGAGARTGIDARGAGHTRCRPADLTRSTAGRSWAP